MSGPRKQRPPLLRHAGLGVELFGAVLGFTLLGIWIDHRYGTSPRGAVICAVLGLIGGLYNLIRQSLRILNSPRSVQKKNHDEPESEP